MVPHAMVVVVVVTVTVGAVLLWALQAEQVPPPRRHLIVRWTGIPGPADIQRRDFPLAVAGYAPHVVDAHLQAVSTAFTALRAGLSDTTVPGDPLPTVEGTRGDWPAVTQPAQASPPSLHDAAAEQSLAARANGGSGAGGSLVSALDD
ncbi:hypothetical protein BH23ACT9_BH23ACT9_00380 [soil metagenome]